ncbi:MAG: lysophospholipid acyltransferase family protein [Acidobacteria bacterium]|nr:lysophospholipid acyltransferase family protein [Acidobacteriota bacterium]
MKSPALERFEYGLYLVIALAIRFLPRAAVLGLGSRLGRLFYRLDKRHRTLCELNLRETLGPGSEAAAGSVFEHFGRMVFDCIKLWGATRSRIAQLIDVEGAEHIESALSKGGVVLFTAHLGNWEVGAIATAIRYGPVLVIARALDNRLLERKLTSKRSALGNDIVEKRESARPVLRALRAGRVVGILMDQRVRRQDGVAGTFLGRPAYTTPAAVRFALQAGAALVPGYCEEIEGGARYRAVYLPAIQLRRDGASRPVEELVQECNDVLSDLIRAHPEQWLWMHDRWRADE